MKRKIIIVIVLVVLIVSILSFFMFKSDKKNYTNYYKIPFEVKIGNEFVLNNTDVVKVGDLSEKSSECYQFSEGYSCSLAFDITISKIASKRFSDITSKLEVNSTPDYFDSNGNLILFLNPNSNSNQDYTGYTKKYYLDRKIDIYFNGTLIDSLGISEDLKGVQISKITLYSYGNGNTVEEAYNKSIEVMKQIQYSVTN